MNKLMGTLAIATLLVAPVEPTGLVRHGLETGLSITYSNWLNIEGTATSIVDVS